MGMASYSIEVPASANATSIIQTINSASKEDFLSSTQDKIEELGGDLDQYTFSVRNVSQPTVDVVEPTEAPPAPSPYGGESPSPSPTTKPRGNLADPNLAAKRDV